MPAQLDEVIATGMAKEPDQRYATTVLPSIGLNVTDGVAVDGAGAVYVADYGSNRVVKLQQH